MKWGSIFSLPALLPCRYVDEEKTKKCILPCTPLAVVKIMEHVGVYDESLPVGDRLQGKALSYACSLSICSRSWKILLYMMPGFGRGLSGIKSVVHAYLCVSTFDGICTSRYAFFMVPGGNDVLTRSDPSF